MHRFFIKKDSITGKVVRITGSDFNHISHSLRLKPGDKIIVNTGNGIDNKTVITDIDSNTVTGEIIKTEENKNEAASSITLAQAIPKKHNMDMVVQKCTEIGVKKIIPLETARTIVKLRGKKRKKRVDRWQKIAEEAAKQSGRGIIPLVMEIHNVNELRDNFSEYDLILIPWTGEKSKGVKKILKNQTNNEINDILVMIGPEGGFTAEEVDMVIKEGGYPVTLGPRILRTETAGPVVSTIIMYEFDEMERG